MIAASLSTAMAVADARSERVAVKTTSECPSSAQVSSALDYALRGASADATAGSGSSALAHPPSRPGPAAPSPSIAPSSWEATMTLEVADLGRRYRVSIAGESREYGDESRDCQERARAAAVFAAITLEPPEIETRAPEPTKVTVGPPRFRLLVGALLEAAPRSAGDVFGFGGEARAALTGRLWGAEIGVGAVSPADIRWGEARARILRLPTDWSLRATLYRSSWAELWATAGLALTFLNLEGDGRNVATRSGGTRLDVGMRGALSLRLWPSAVVAPFVAIHASISPSPYVVVVDPGGEVGTTPSTWVGGTLGMSVELR